MIEASNSADSVAAETDKAIKEFKAQVDAEEAKKVEGLVAELRELAIKSQGDGSGITAAQIKEKVAETQQASLSLFQKVSLDLLSVAHFTDIFLGTLGLREESC